MRKSRILGVMILFLLIFTGLMGRIFYFQVIEGKKIAQSAASMRSRPIELREYCRGEILDRNLLPLTGNNISSALYCFPRVLKEKSKGSNNSGYCSSRNIYEKNSTLLSQILNNMDQASIAKKIKKAAEAEEPFVNICSDLSTDEIMKINKADIPGVIIAPLVKRYRQDGFCVHVLGYVAETYHGEGKTGIELAYEDELKGGRTQAAVTVLDARGMAIQGLIFKIKEEEDNKGYVVLTIDKRIQEIVEKIMDRTVKKGAVVVMDVESKDILAMASRPAFNPYKIEKYIKHVDEPLRNRALEAYHPGSIFKIVTTIAALEEGIVKEEDQFYCSGEYNFNDTISISCWKKEGHGKINFAEAFAYSCNPSFIELALELGKKRLLYYADNLFLTDENISGYPYVKSNSYINIEGGPAALGNATLGQEGVKLSPVQIASLLATIADNGTWALPRLVRYSINQFGEKSICDRTDKQQIISVETAAKVKSLMEKVVQDGTGKTAAMDEVKAAGKTATSQTGVYDNGREILNTWFAGYLPADDPRWVIVVMTEDSHSSSRDSAPVFKAIAKEMLKYHSIN